MENSQSVLFDALVLPDGREAIQALARNEHTIDFIKDLFRHCKTILALGAGRELLELAGVGAAIEGDSGILLADSNAGNTSAFIKAIAAHRHPSRDRDPSARGAKL